MLEAQQQPCMRRSGSYVKGAAAAMQEAQEQPCRMGSSRCAGGAAAAMLEGQQRRTCRKALHGQVVQDVHAMH